MSSDARPSQVTIAGWVVLVASVMLVVAVFDAMAGLQSVDTRDELARTLDSGAAKDLGISLDDALAVMRVALFVAGAAAAMTAILAFFVLQRHTAARIALTVAAVPVVLTSPLSGGFLGLLVGASVVLLWSRPARDWFAGRPVTQPAGGLLSWGRGGAEERSTPPSRPVAPERPTLPPPTAEPSSGPLPPPTPGWPAPPDTWSAYPPPDPGTAYTGPAPLAEDTRMPTTVRIACILTWVFAGITGLGYLVLAIAVAADRDAVLDLVRDNASIRDADLGDDTLVATMLAVSVLIALWCLSAAVFAWFAWRRQRWAWLVLTVGVGVAVLACILAIPFALLHLVAAAVTFRLLVHSRSRAWFAPRRMP